MVVIRGSVPSPQGQYSPGIILFWMTGKSLQYTPRHYQARTCSFLKILECDLSATLAKICNLQIQHIFMVKNHTLILPVFQCEICPQCSIDFNRKYTLQFTLCIFMLRKKKVTCHFFHVYSMRIVSGCISQKMQKKNTSNMRKKHAILKKYISKYVCF